MLATDPSNPASSGRQRDPIFRFAECRLDGRSQELTVRGVLTRLEPKPLEVLLLLLRHPGEVVTKDELLDGVWAGRIVSDSVLTKTVARLRLALGDEAQEVIRTVHGYGYRLIAPVTHEDPGTAAPAAPQLALAIGDRPPLRPHWRLTARLGSGGLGEVWLAVHDETAERRVFKFALDAPGLAALKREITLSRVLTDTHGERGDLIRVLDRNIDEAPYFVETAYAAGGALTDWAAAQGGLAAVPLAMRLELVAQAADALAAAHAAGVLHKDLKPGNLLIDLDAGGAPSVRIGDFGSGRMMDLARLERLEITRLGFTRVAIGDPETGGSGGTPYYLAPELIAGQQPTVQSDVYALGVVLYQMIVGDLKRPLSASWERDVDDELLREDVAAAAAGRVDERLRDAADLARRLRSLDLRREHRDSLRQQAREADALRESLVRATTRRRLLRAVSVSLAIGLVLSVWQFRLAQQAQRAAEASAREAEAVAGFVTEDLLNLADPLLSVRPQLTVRDLLTEASRRLDQHSAVPPLARARILKAIGKAHEGLGDWPAARKVLTAALAEVDALTRPDDEASLSIVVALAYAMVLSTDYDAAEKLYQRVLAAQPVLGAGHDLIIDARDGLAFLDTERGDVLPALARYEMLRADLVRLGRSDRLTDINWTLPDLYLDLNRVDDAQRAIELALADTVRVVGAGHPRVQWMRLTLGDVLMARGDWDAADALYLESLAALDKALGSEHPYTLTALHYHGHLLLKRGRPAEARPVLEAALAGRQRAHGADHPYPRFSAHRLGQTLTALGEADRAVALLDPTLKQSEAALGARHPISIDIRCSLAEALLATGMSERARALIAEALPWAQRPELAGTDRRQRVERLAGKLTAA